MDAKVLKNRNEYNTVADYFLNNQTASEEHSLISIYTQ
jgi:hypothetical protein